MFRSPFTAHVFLLAAVAAVPTVACGDDGDTQPIEETGPVSLGVETSGALSVELLADGPLAVGLNRVYFRLTADGVPVTAATITQVPVMHMTEMGMEHSCPCEQPPAVADADGLFPGWVVFQMAGGLTGDTWREEVTVERDGAEPVDVVFEGFAVSESGARKDLTITTAMGSSTAIVTLNFAATPTVGKNPFTVTVHQRADMMGMSWAALDDLVVTATPDMPSMGHGSTGNVDPVHVAAGRYDGSVNLTMPGTWRIVLAFARDGVELGAVEYTIII